MTINLLLRQMLCCLLPAGLIGCCGQSIAVIDGRLPDGRYDGETVYLVPVKNATADNVDSTFIRKGAFRFERIPSGNQDDVRIVRTRPLLRLSLQELLIILEPGRLLVNLDSLSYARGTASNDSLQQWKEKKQQYDDLRQRLHERLQTTADVSQRTNILADREQADMEYASYTYRFVERNRENAAGRFIYHMNRYLFTPEQRQTLQMPD